jgi:septal ring factor EnvC (AmiA/AmiB activator)
MIKEALNNLGDIRSRMFRELRKNLNCELFDMQNQLSELKKENRELKTRIKELEINWAYAIAQVKTRERFERESG